jgi:hypothetical protein
MDADRFDALSRSLTASGSRRHAVAAFLGGVLGSAVGAASIDEATAKKKCPPCKKRKQGRCKGKKPDGTPCPGGTCQGGQCTTALAPSPVCPAPCPFCRVCNPATAQCEVCPETCEWCFTLSDSSTVCGDGGSTVNKPCATSGDCPAEDPYCVTSATALGTNQTFPWCGFACCTRIERCTA